jgi:hypothetical protein
MGYYMTGDFYRGGRGDYYRRARGDIFGDIGGFIKNTALPFINKTIGPQGIMTGFKVATGQMSPMAALGTLMPSSMAATSPGSTALQMLPPPGFMSPKSFGSTVGTLATRGAANLVVKGAKAIKNMMLPEPGYGYRRRYRRMNVCNPRALRRALRRAKGFESFAKEVVHITNRKKVVSGFRMPRRRKRRA